MKNKVKRSEPRKAYVTRILAKAIKMDEEKGITVPTHLDSYTPSILGQGPFVTPEIPQVEEAAHIEDETVDCCDLFNILESQFRQGNPIPQIRKNET